MLNCGHGWVYPNLLGNKPPPEIRWSWFWINMIWLAWLALQTIHSFILQNYKILRHISAWEILQGNAEQLCSHSHWSTFRCLLFNCSTLYLWVFYFYISSAKTDKSTDISMLKHDSSVSRFRPYKVSAQPENEWMNSLAQQEEFTTTMKNLPLCMV